MESMSTVLMSELSIDALTGVASAAHLRSSLDAACVAADPLRQPLSVAMIDVDHFAAFNERFGQPAGDCELVRIARLIAGMSRPVDLVGRLRADRFVWLMPNTDAIAAADLVEDLRAAVQLNVPPQFELTVSIGFVTTWKQSSSDELIAAVRLALQEAKGNGRNLVAMFRPAAL